MTKYEFLNFVSKLGVTLGILFVIYQNHYNVSATGSIGLGAIVIIGFVLFKNYKDVKKFCLEEALRLREKDNLRIKTYRRKFFAYLFIWIHIVGPFGLFYAFNVYLQETQQTMLDTSLYAFIITCIGAIIAFFALFADNSN